MNGSAGDSIDDRKTASVDKLAKASNRMASALARKERNDTTMNMAKLHSQMGDQAQAQRLLQTLKENQEKDAKEDEEMAKETDKPPAVSGREQSPMSDVTNPLTGTDSGHIITAAEKAVLDDDTEATADIMVRCRNLGKQNLNSVNTGLDLEDTEGNEMGSLEQVNEMECLGQVNGMFEA